MTTRAASRLSRRTPLRLIAEVGVTPMLDLGLVLLFVFLIVAPLLQIAPPAGPASAQSTHELVIQPDGGLRLDGTAVPADQLAPEMLKLRADEPQAGVVILIDQSERIERLSRVLDVLRDARIARVALEAAPATPR